MTTFDHEWTVMLQSKIATSVHYGSREDIEALERAGARMDARAIDGPRMRTEWESLALKDKVARGLKLE